MRYRHFRGGAIGGTLSILQPPKWQFYILQRYFGFTFYILKIINLTEHFAKAKKKKDVLPPLFLTEPVFGKGGVSTVFRGRIS